MDEKALYEAAGIDYDKGLERFMHNVDLYKKFLQKFLYDGSFEEFCAGVNMHDLAMAEKSVHTLKGTAGNLSMMRLFNAADATVQAIRQGKTEEELKPLVQAVKEAYQAACDVVVKTSE